MTVHNLQVFVGLGSMLEAAFVTQQDRAAFLSKIHSALQRANCTAIVCTHGCDSPPSPPPNVMNFTGTVAHSWLFPQCSVVVSHGGAGTRPHALPHRTSAIILNFAGTVHAALLSACACITLPALPDESDQLFWAARLHAIGADTCMSTCDQRYEL